MTEDKTAPMQQPQWARREVEPEGQDTVLAGQDSPTPPTLPAGAPEPGTPPSPAFVRSVPPAQPAGQPHRPAQPPPAVQPGQPPHDQTMLIGQRQAATVFAWLVVVDGPDQNTIGQVHTLHPDTSTIGRAQGNYIGIHDDACSGQHARIRVEAEEDKVPEFVLYDMGSRNGTFVGSRDTYRDEENRTYRHTLQDGDYMLIGETTLAFKRL